ncbi:MAG: TonB family protein [Candidatus Latescibacteria bacterium]|nr:TonB family protein [Candidatus Latescibacterota bacterium]MDP7235207.1 TonB family protein [Candidatus Latescibacterota bacterium]
MIQRWFFYFSACLSMSCAGAPPPVVTSAPEDTPWPEAMMDTLLISNQPPSLDHLLDNRPDVIPPERSEAAIREGVRINFHLIGPCFAFVKDNPDLQGVVKLDLTITPDGRVRRTGVIDNTTGNRDLGRCLASAATLWMFKPVKEEEDRIVTVTLPFRLR